MPAPTKPLPSALEDSLGENFGSEAVEVLTDWLLGRGDPRGQLMAAQRERDEARVLLLKCGLWFSTWRRHLLVADTTKEAARRAWDDLEELHNACAAMGGSK